MNEHDPHHGRDEHGHEPVESSAIQPKPILLFLTILFFATTFVFVIVKGLDWGFRKLDEPNQGQPETQVVLPAEQSRKLPPEPRLQGAPGAGSTSTSDKPTELPLVEMERVRRETDEKIAGYSWIDKQTGVARIPVDRAKAMIAEKGLPALTSAALSEEVQKAEAVRKLSLNADSSAGQLLGVQPQNRRPVEQPVPQSAPQSAQPPSAKPQRREPRQGQEPAQPQKH